MSTGPSSPYSAWHPVGLAATWFGSGLLPRAPGTWGSLAALPFAALIVWASGPIGLAVAAAALFMAGIWVAGAYARRLGAGDPGTVVVDEVVGQWVALLPAGLDPGLYALGFVLFRVFDVGKVWPVGWIDRRVKGGLGIMADDLAAAVYAGVIVYGASQWMG